MPERRATSLLYLDNVTVAFDGFKALNALSLVVEPGEMRAVIGPNGAGKTTMMDVATGKTRPDEGEVYFAGHIDLAKRDEAEIAQLGIGRKFQKPTVFDSHTVRDNPELALAGRRDLGASLPGEVIPAEGEIELNAGRPTVTLTVANTGDRPVQVGSHYHFHETNPALAFDREAARGMRLDIPAGTAVRFEPGQSREVTLVPYGGARRVFGFRGAVMGPLSPGG